MLPEDSTRLELLYRGSISGWEPENFHKKCDNKGRTVTIFKNWKGFLAAGYTSLSWTSEGGDKKDDSAFVCALTDKMQLFRPGNPSKVVYHSSSWGPNW